MTLLEEAFMTPTVKLPVLCSISYRGTIIFILQLLKYLQNQRIQSSIQCYIFASLKDMISLLILTALCTDSLQELSDTSKKCDAVSNWKIIFSSSLLLRFTELISDSLTAGTSGYSTVITLLLKFFFLLLQIPLFELLLCLCNACSTKL